MQERKQSLGRREFLKTSAKFGAMAVGALSLGACDSKDSAQDSQNVHNHVQNGSANVPITQNIQGDTMEFVTLNNGVKMPILGYGTYQIPPQETQRCVEDAISVGYRSIDTASIYQNEEGVGAAIKTALNGGVKREELFITTKLWTKDMSESKAKAAFETSLKKLQIDYLDLYLIHWAIGDTYGAWRVMSDLHKQGLIKAIGVSNFYPSRLVDFCLHNTIKPALNQVECNPFHPQFEAQKIMQEYNVAMQSWASFGEGKKDIFTNPTIAQIGKNYNKSNAQVILRWLIQRQIIVIPKTTRKERMIENLNVFDFTLKDTEMQTMASLQSGNLFFSPTDVETIKALS